MSAFELVQAYRKGWRDGASTGAQKKEFIEHKTRPDLRHEYLNGWSDGLAARAAANTRACKRLGYEPNLLRGEKP